MTWTSEHDDPTKIHCYFEAKLGDRMNASCVLIPGISAGVVLLEVGLELLLSFSCRVFGSPAVDSIRSNPTLRPFCFLLEFSFGLSFDQVEVFLHSIALKIRIIASNTSFDK